MAGQRAGDRRGDDGRRLRRLPRALLRFVNRGHRIPQLVNSLQSGAAAYARLRPLLAPALPSPASLVGPLSGPGTWPASLGEPRRRPVPLPDPFRYRCGTSPFHYPGAERPALRGLSLDIPAGALVAVTGPVGSGKSALARAMLGVYPRDVGNGPRRRHAAGRLCPSAARRGLVRLFAPGHAPVLWLAAAEHRLRPVRPARG